MDHSQTTIDKLPTKLPTNTVIDTLTGRRPQLSTRAKRVMIAKLLVNPMLSHPEIADMVGCSTRSVSRVAKLVVDEKSLSAAERESYRRLIRKRVPDSKAVDALVDQLEDVRFALPAIKYRDQMLGLAPVADPEQARQPQPLFAFGGDASINVTINQAIVRNPAEIMVSEGNKYPPDAVSTVVSKR